jgi:hypothetical protein
MRDNAAYLIAASDAESKRLSILKENSPDYVYYSDVTAEDSFMLI